LGCVVALVGGAVEEFRLAGQWRFVAVDLVVIVRDLVVVVEVTAGCLGAVVHG